MPFLRLFAHPLTVLALWTLASASWATTYVVLPLVGDQLTIVTAQMRTGSNLDRNVHDVRPLADRVLDNALLKFTDEAIRKAQANASVVLARVNDPRLYALRSTWINTEALLVGELLDALKGKIDSTAGVRLIVITPYRGELELATEEGHVGHGKVSGLGFYLDRYFKMQRSDTAEASVGFLGVFANLRISLVDVASRSVIAERSSRAGLVVSAARAADGDPWNALSDAEKLPALEHIMKHEIDRLVPVLLQQEAGK